MIIKILGTGCAKCTKLEENVKKALSIKGVAATVEKVSDMGEIMDYGVMITPALVIDDKVVSSGKLLKPEEIVKLLK